MISLAIADDHQMFIDGVKALLRNEKDITVCGEALSGDALIQLVESAQPDIVLIDISMPGGDGISTTKYLTENFKDLKIIALTMHQGNEYVQRIISAGALGYVLKNTGKKELCEAIRTVFSGSTYYSPEVAKGMLDAMRKSEKQNSENANLSEREKDVLKLVAQEFSTKQIADKLFISVNTVETHRKNIFSKLNAKNLAGLVKYAIQQGLID